MYSEAFDKQSTNSSCCCSQLSKAKPYLLFVAPHTKEHFATEVCRLHGELRSSLSLRPIYRSPGTRQTTQRVVTLVCACNVVWPLRRKRNAKNERAFSLTLNRHMTSIHIWSALYCLLSPLSLSLSRLPVFWFFIGFAFTWSECTPSILSSAVPVTATQCLSAKSRLWFTTAPRACSTNVRYAGDIWVNHKKKEKKSWHAMHWHGRVNGNSCVCVCVVGWVEYCMRHAVS